MTELPIGARHEIAGNKLGALNVELQQKLRAETPSNEEIQTAAKQAAKDFPSGLAGAKRVYRDAYRVLYLNAAANATDE